MKKHPPETNVESWTITQFLLGDTSSIGWGFSIVILVWDVYMAPETYSQVFLPMNVGRNCPKKEGKRGELWLSVSGRLLLGGSSQLVSS